MEEDSPIISSVLFSKSKAPVGRILLAGAFLFVQKLKKWYNVRGRK